MTYQHAGRRFNVLIAISTAIFLLACLALTFVRGIADPIIWLICAIAVIALLTPVWAQWRYINEIDEFLRSIQIKAIFIGLATILVIASAWGFVEMYVDATAVSMFWLNPIYWVAYAIAALYFTRREGVEA